MSCHTNTPNSINCRREVVDFSRPEADHPTPLPLPRWISPEIDLDPETKARKFITLAAEITTQAVLRRQSLLNPLVRLSQVSVDVLPIDSTSLNSSACKVLTDLHHVSLCILMYM